MALNVYKSTLSNDRWSWSSSCVTVSFPAENLVQERLWTPNVSFSTLRQSQCLETRRKRPCKEKCRWGKDNCVRVAGLIFKINNIVLKSFPIGDAGRSNHFSQPSAWSFWECQNRDEWQLLTLCELISICLSYVANSNRVNSYESTLERLGNSPPLILKHVSLFAHHQNDNHFPHVIMFLPFKICWRSPGWHFSWRMRGVTISSVRSLHPQLIGENVAHNVT